MNIRTLVLVLVATIHGSRGTLRATLDFELSRTKAGPASTRQTQLMIHPTVVLRQGLEHANTDFRSPRRAAALDR